jgi:hypothetical protein
MGFLIGPEVLSNQYIFFLGQEIDISPFLFPNRVFERVERRPPQHLHFV